MALQDFTYSEGCGCACALKAPDFADSEFKPNAGCAAHEVEGDPRRAEFVERARKQYKKNKEWPK